MHYWLQDIPDQSTQAVLGQVPGRWGRMDPISRLAVVEVGRLLREAGLLTESAHLIPESLRVGLVAGTERGSLATDLAYAEDLKSGDLVSPNLFCYTLANVPLSEAAVHYRLQGPVYSIFTEQPLAESIQEATFWLRNDLSLDFMIAGALDYFPAQQGSGDLMHQNSQFKLISLK